ncbi:hypothetical protein AB7294_03095 [Cylindrospermopsis raciborskii UAM/DH-MRr]
MVKQLASYPHRRKTSTQEILKGNVTELLSVDKLSCDLPQGVLRDRS